MGRVDKGVRCSVEGCGERAERSLSRDKASGLRLSETGRRVYICQKHYKELKKQIKRDKDLEKLRWI